MIAHAVLSRVCKTKLALRVLLVALFHLRHLLYVTLLAFPPQPCHVLGHAQAESPRVMTFANDEDVLSFRHHMYEKRSGKEVVLNEVGPRFEMQLYQLRLGTLDQVCVMSM